MTAATNIQNNECRPVMLVFYNTFRNDLFIKDQHLSNTDTHLLILCTPTTRVHMCFHICLNIVCITLKLLNRK